jgi:outer membrane protein TolC
VKKGILLIALMVALIFPYQSYATDNNSINNDDLNWNKALIYLGRYNNTLLNMSETVNKAKREYDLAVERAEDIETEGITVEIMGKETFIEYDYYTKMMMTQQKELMPEQMKFSWEMNRDSWNAVRNSMTIGLRSYYLGLYSAHCNNILKQRNYELVSSIHNQNRIKYEKGMITDIDLAGSEFDLLKAKAEADASKRNYENMLRSFNAFLGTPLDRQYSDIVFDETYDSKRLKELDYYLERAQKTRYDFVSISKQVSLMEKKKNIMDRYPLSLNTVSARKDYDNNIADIEKAKQQLEVKKLDLEMEITDSYIEVSSAGKNVVSMKKILDLQKSSLEKTKRMYELGMVSKTVMEQVQLGYDEFEINYNAVLFDYNTKLMKLEFQSGTGLAF